MGAMRKDRQVVGRHNTQVTEYDIKKDDKTLIHTILLIMKR